MQQYIVFCGTQAYISERKQSIQLLWLKAYKMTLKLQPRLWAASGQEKARQGQLYQRQGHSLNTACLPFAIKSSCTPKGCIMRTTFLLLIGLRIKMEGRRDAGQRNRQKQSPCSSNQFRSSDFPQLKKRMCLCLSRLVFPLAPILAECEEEEKSQAPALYPRKLTGERHSEAI